MLFLNQTMWQVQSMDYFKTFLHKISKVVKWLLPSTSRRSWFDALIRFSSWICLTYLIWYCEVLMLIILWLRLKESQVNVFTIPQSWCNLQGSPACIPGISRGPFVVLCHSHSVLLLHTVFCDPTEESAALSVEQEPARYSRQRSH